MKPILRTTDLGTPVADIAYGNDEIKTIAQIVSTADLLAQMGDEIYPEKLGGLFKEFQEAGVPGFDTEYDLVRETAGFASIMDARLENDLGDVEACMSAHFNVRWGAELDIYRTFIDKNIKYLKGIVRDHGEDYHTKLRRNSNRRPPFV